MTIMLYFHASGFKIYYLHVMQHRKDFRYLVSYKGKSVGNSGFGNFCAHV